MSVAVGNSSTAPDRPLRSRLVLAILLTCQLMIILDVTVMNVALPAIRADLGFSAVGLSWVLDAYTLAFGGLLLLGGRLGDLCGRRRMFLVGVGIFTVASLLGGAALAPGWLLAARAAQGVGAALAGPNALALLTTLFTEPKERMRALALYSGMAGAGFAIGLIVGGALTEWFGWRAGLLINVPLGGAAVLAALRYLPDVPRRPARPDLPGAVLATTGVGALVYGFISAAAHGWRDTATDLALVAGVLLLVAFLVVERRAAQPLLPLGLFADRNRAVAYFNIVVGYMGSMSMFFFLTLYLQDVHHMSALATGVAFLPTAVLMFAMMRLVPRLLPRFGPKPVTMAGSASMVAGMVVLTQLTTGTPYFPMVFAAAVLMGVGVGLALMPLSVIIMTDVPAEVAGAAGGAMQTAQQTGTALGLAILVSVFGTGARGVAGPAEHALVAGVTAAFAAAAVMAAMTFAGASAFRRTEPRI
ncbi:MFS transporter [Nocardia sp. NPDC056064]|uniref:MFS transporter n=1 Tax=Nocardia sp. NPDC056064 TaxID=3345701 RepID=UPI0035E0A06E